MVNMPVKHVPLTIDSCHKIVGEVMVDIESVIMVNWKYKEPENDRSNNYNLAIASFVTAYARLELLDLMENIEKNRPGSLLYFDTDSVFFKWVKGYPVIKTGDYFGDLTDEVGNNRKCKKVVSLGPKNYGYEIKKNNGNTEVVLKIKGLSLTEKALSLVSIEKMFEISKSYVENKRIKLEIPQCQFKIDKVHVIRTLEIEKVFRSTSDKRIIGNLTLPYGY